MLAESDLRELVAFTPGNEPVLSVYLDTEPTSGNADVCQLRLRNMLKAINLPEDASAVERYISLEYKWSGRGVAVFSSVSRQFFRAYSLALPVRDLYHVGDRPSVQPLLDLIDNYGGYGIVLLDKQGARLFNFHLGELREEEDVQGEQVRGFQEKPLGDGGWINGGFFVLEPAVLDYIAGDGTTWENEPMRRLAEDGQLMSHLHRGFWQPMDTLRDRMLLEAHWKNGEAAWQLWR